MARRESLGSNIEPGVVSRIAAGFRYALFGQAPNDWFGPSDPLPPAAQTQAEGRQFDYRTGFNVTTRPRSEEAISFATMRALADNCDLLRLVIETRKDQLASLEWAIAPKDEDADPDQRCEDIEKFLAAPDLEHQWDEWLRMLLEDLFVLDAPTIYRRKTNGGDPYALELIDGSTIKRVIDVTGRTPMDGTAYQQVLKGVPAVDYTREELLYRPRNPRTHKVYGYSPVEQVINTVNTALRRALLTLNYFTEGTVPDALAGVPVDWTVNQIAEFQTYWDSLLQDDQAARRKLKFVPGEIAKNFHETKQPPLKDMFDEWLARLICYAFSIDPTPFVAQVNRSVAETTREQSRSEGLAPLKKWIKSTIDIVIVQDFGFSDLQFVWKDEEVIDAATKATTLCAYVAAKVLHPDEARKELGYPPLTAEQKLELTPPPPPTLGGDAGDPGDPGQKPPTDTGEKPAGDAGYKGQAVKKSDGPVVHVHPPDVVVDVGAITVHAHIDGRTDTQRIERAASTSPASSGD